jgi:hypothetical protein
MVAASGRATQENTLNYMKAVLDMYQSAYRAFTPPMSPFEFIQRGPGAPAVPPVQSPPGPEDAPTHEQELQKRVEELEALVAKLAAQKRRKRPKSNPRRKR